jgi:hypothetical protein
MNDDARCAAHKSKKQYMFLNANWHSAQPGVFWTAHHTKPDPQWMRVKPLCLWGV